MIMVMENMKIGGGQQVYSSAYAPSTESPRKFFGSTITLANQ